MSWSHKEAIIDTMFAQLKSTLFEDEVCMNASPAGMQAQSNGTAIVDELHAMLDEYIVEIASSGYVLSADQSQIGFILQDIRTNGRMRPCNDWALCKDASSDRLRITTNVYAPMKPGQRGFNPSRLIEHPCLAAPEEGNR